MKKLPTPVLFFDTNQWRSLSIPKEITFILNACKAGKLSIFISEWVVWEYARQYFERQRDAILSQFEVFDEFTDYTQGEILQAHHLCFKSMLGEYGVVIIDHSVELKDLARELIADETTYFSSEDIHDQRDALIFASAIQNLPLDTTAVLTADRNLKKEFLSRGYDVHTNAKDYISGLDLERTGKRLDAPDIIPTLRSIRNSGGGGFSTDFHLTLQEVDSTYAESFLPGAVIEKQPGIDLNEAMQRVNELGKNDKEIRIVILSYVFWFDPISKDELISMLQKKQIPEKLIPNNSDRLVAAGSIVDTGTHYLPGKDGVCEAIGISRIGELAELVKGAEYEA